MVTSQRTRLGTLGLMGGGLSRGLDGAAEELGAGLLRGVGRSGVSAELRICYIIMRGVQRRFTMPSG